MLEDNSEEKINILFWLSIKTCKESVAWFSFHDLFPQIFYTTSYFTLNLTFKDKYVGTERHFYIVCKKWICK